MPDTSPRPPAPRAPVAPPTPIKAAAPKPIPEFVEGEPVKLRLDGDVEAALKGELRQGQGDLLVMGAYGRGQVMSFLGLGGATGKVISSCRVPVFMAH